MATLWIYLIPEVGAFYIACCGYFSPVKPGRSHDGICGSEPKAKRIQQSRTLPEPPITAFSVPAFLFLCSNVAREDHSHDPVG